MYINAVLSNLDTWDRLQRDRSHLIREIEQVIGMLDKDLEYEQLNGKEPVITLPSFYKSLNENLVALGWENHIRLKLSTREQSRVLGEIDFAKEDVGLEMGFSKTSKVESYLFAKIPFFIKAGKFRTAIIVMPQKHLKDQFIKGMGTFEYMRELLMGFPSIPLQYPFVILGINDVPQSLQITHLNSAIDVFLIQKLGLTLSEVLIEGEAQAYDFKEELPNNTKTAQEVCGFANQEGGGMLLIGIADDGSVPGIDPDEWDSIQTRLASIISSSVSPAPVFAIHRFEVPEDSERIIVVLEISENSHKPCMTRDRVYVRKSASVRPATTEDIRRMLIR